MKKIGTIENNYHIYQKSVHSFLIQFEVEGHTISFEDFKFCEWMSEETNCFRATMVVDGKKISTRNQMRIYYEGKKTTLHKVWDGMSIRELYPDYGKDYEKFRVELDKLNAKKRAKMCEGTPADWLVQNAKDCRYIYDEIDREDRIEYDYILRNKKLSKLQCLRAAYRLAHVLNECLQ